MKHTSVARKRRFSMLVFGLATVAALVFWGGSAAATVIGQEHYSGTDSYSFDDCGFTLNGESTFSGVLKFRALKGGEAFLVTDNYSYRDVLTNPATGKWFVIRGNGVFHEIKATHISGNIYEFTAIEAGQPFILEDAAGNIVAKDRGVIRQSAIFDTLGDGQPSAELIESTGVTVHGPHPGFADDFPFCEIAAELTGA